MQEHTEERPVLSDYAALQIASVASALGFSSTERDRVVELFRRMSSSFGSWPLDSAPRWSGFSDDCSPYEISVVFGGERPELRFALEAQADRPSVSSYWQSGTALNEWLVQTHGANLDAFHRVEDLFVPTDPQAYLAMWHAACSWPEASPAFKLYLNPAAQGRGRSQAVVDETLRRLGFPWAGAALAQVMRPNDLFVGVGLDLSATLGGRAKVYVRLPNADPEHLERCVNLAADSRPGDARAFAATITGSEAALTRRAALVCYSFVEDWDDSRRPRRAALLISPGAYAANDAVIRSRIRSLLAGCDLSPEPYDRCAQAFAPGDPRADPSAHGYVSWQRESGRPRVTAYFYARAFRERFGEVDPVSPWPSPHAAYRPPDGA